MKELPFVVCVNSFDPYLDKHSIQETLFGLAVNDDAYFISKGRPQNRGVSAVLVFKNLVPWNLHCVDVVLWHNPWALCPLNTDQLSFDQIFYSDDTLVIPSEQQIIKGITVRELLSIDPEYINETIE